jgi:hypothetical protein
MQQIEYRFQVKGKNYFRLLWFAMVEFPLF